MNRRIFLGAVPALVASRAALGQSASEFSYEKETSLSGGETVTIHLPSTSNKTVRFVGAEIYCSTAATFELLQNGGAPTTTEATVVALNGGTPSARAFHTSNVGSSGGTHIKYYTLAAGSKEVIDLTRKGLTVGQNLTLKTPATSGTARIFFQWSES